MQWNILKKSIYVFRSTKGLLAHLDIVSGLCWKHSHKSWIVPPVLHRCKNIATCSSAEICFECLRPACNSNSCTSFQKTCFGIQNASLKCTGWPVSSFLSHAMPVRTEVFIGVVMAKSSSEPWFEPDQSPVQSSGRRQNWTIGPVCGSTACLIPQTCLNRFKSFWTSAKYCKGFVVNICTHIFSSLHHNMLGLLTVSVYSCNCTPYGHQPHEVSN